MTTRGTLHLIPVSLGQVEAALWLPASVQAQAGRLNTYIAENAKTARSFLKQMPIARPLQEITIHELGPKTDEHMLRQWLEP